MRNVLLKLQDSRFPSCPMAELLEKPRIWRICSDKSASKTPEIHPVWMGETPEKPRICRSSSVPNIKMSQTIAHPKLHFTPGLGQLSVQIDGQRMALAGRFSGEGMAIFLRFFLPCWSILEEFCLRAHPLSKPIASENRSVRESQNQKGLEAHPLSEPCVQLHTLELFCRQPPRKKPSRVRKSQRQRVARQRVARQRVAGPNSPIVPTSVAFLGVVAQAPVLHLVRWQKTPEK